MIRDRQGQTLTMVDIKQIFDAVLWLGGAPCAGKSSVADLIGARYNLDVYHIDDIFDTYLCTLNEHAHPALKQWAASTWDQRWMRSEDILLQEVIACYREQLSLALAEAKRRLPKDRKLLVEGSALLPGEIAPMLVSPKGGAWLIPVAEFQARHYASRGWVREVLNQCSDQEMAFGNWMGRDAAFARWLAAQVEELGLWSIEVDGSQSIEEVAEAVANHYGM